MTRSVTFSSAAYRHVKKRGGECYISLIRFSDAFDALGISLTPPQGTVLFRLERIWHPGRPFADDGINVYLDETLSVPVNVTLSPLRRRLRIASVPRTPGILDSGSF
jgi:hypothetical protein